jgi:hypothetical protein
VGRCHSVRFARGCGRQRVCVGRHRHRPHGQHRRVCPRAP